MALFFLTVGGDPQHIKLGIVNLEMENFSSCSDYSVNRTLGGIRDPDEALCTYTGLSCKFLLGLPDKLNELVS